MAYDDLSAAGSPRGPWARVPALLGVLAAAALSAGFAGAAGAQQASVPAFHVEATPTKHLSARLTVVYSAAALSAAEWVLFAPVAPELPSQQKVTTRFGVPALPAIQAKPVTDLSPSPRPFLLLTAPVQDEAMRQSVTTVTHYEADLFSRKLVPGAPATPAPALTAGEKKAYLASTPQVDHASEPFQKALDAAGLRREAQEDALTYAQRVFRFIRGHYRYQFPAERQASRVCATDRSDCGGISILFAAALRANGIPARILFGRWALPQKDDYGQWHARPEFFVDGIGWVPAEPTGAIAWNLPDPDRLFGGDDGNFLAMHVDTDLTLDSVYWGKQVVMWSQFPIHFATGTGSQEGANLREEWHVETR